MKQIRDKLLNSNTQKRSGFVKKLLSLLLAAAILPCISACQDMSASALGNEGTEPASDDSDFLYTLYVLDESELPLKDAEVRLFTDDVQTFTGVSDEYGKIQWMLTAGPVYRAEAELEGYEELENKSLLQIITEDEMEVKIFMKPIESEPAIPAEGDPQGTEQPDASDALPDEQLPSGDDPTPDPTEGTVIDIFPTEDPSTGAESGSPAAPAESEAPFDAEAPTTTPSPLSEIPTATPSPSETSPAETVAPLYEEPTQYTEQYPALAEPVIEPAPTAAPLPVPTNYIGTITFYAPDVSIDTTNNGFDLMTDVYCVNDANEEVYVWVVNDGGFSSVIPGIYVVEYAAFQGDEIVSVTRTITVNGDAQGTELRPSAPTSNSYERYKKLVAYRDEIYAELSPRMQALGAEMNEYIAELVMDKQNVQYMKQAPLFEDDPEAEKVTVNHIKMMSFIETDTLAVSNWSDILAVYIAKNSLDVEEPLDLFELRNISFDGLSDVFHDMVRINVMQSADTVNVLVYTCTYEEMAIAYDFSEKQADLLYELMQPEFQRAFASLTGNTAFEFVQDDEERAALEALDGNLSISRESVVSTAYSLVGKLTYFWGGKSNSLGWNSGWGFPRIVTSKNSRTTGQERPYGLDCSGFVSWVFINAAGDPDVLNVIGNGSSNQWTKSMPIGWDEGRPGDLAFYAAPGERNINHVGIITDVLPDGSYLVTHCSSSMNGVVVTEAWSSGFRYLRRPILLLDEEYNIH